MSGFDPAWLDLREPADHAARAPCVLAEVASAFRDRPSIFVADLAAGSGSTLRALAPRLGPSQAWTLLDHDADLLSHARRTLAAWSDEAEERDGVLWLRREGAAISVRTLICDLSREPLPAAAVSADLVTASALFDLVGEAWLESFIDRLARARRPLYAALSYVGAARFEPAHPLDDAVFAAFSRHQARDKGFGPALGPHAVVALTEAARRAGYGIERGASPWRLGPAEAALTADLVAGMARAVAELPDAPDGAAAWLSFRLASAASGWAEIGHVDLLLRPVD